MKRAERYGLAALLLVTLARLLLAAFTELSPDEAYYLLWAQRLDWSYYSKGPGIALALNLTTSLFGETQFGIRVLSPLLGLGTSLVAWELGRRTVGRTAAFWAVVAFNLTPIFNAGSILMTIDPLMMFCWAAAMLTFWLALHESSRKRALRWWAGTGAALAVGFLAKYTILVVFLTILVYLAMEKRQRVEFRRPGFWIATLLLLLSMIPVVVWNAQHDWITVRHLLERTGIFLKDEAAAASPEFPIRPGDFLAYLGMHFGVYSPLLFAGLLAALWICVRHFRRSESEFFLGLFSVPLIVFYLLLSLGDTGEVNWTAPGFVGLGLLAVRYFEQWSARAKVKRRWTAWALATSALMSLWAVNPDTPRLTGLSWPYQRDPFLRLRGWETAAEELESFVRRKTARDGERPFIIANRYQTAATLAFYGDGLDVIQPSAHYPVVSGRIFEGGEIKNQFPFWPSYLLPERAEDRQSFLGKDAVYVSDWKRHERPPEDVRVLFESWEPSYGFEVVRRGRMVRTWKIFTCYGYKGGDGSEQGGP